MADVNVNVNVRRFQNGGQVRIVSGSDTLVVVNVDSGQGALTYTVAGLTPIYFTDRGVLQPPLKGEEQPISLTLRLKASASNGANELKTLLMADKASPDNLKRMFDITFRFPAHPSATTGVSEQFSKCVCTGVSYNSGGPGEYDTLECTFSDQENSPTYGTY